MGRKRGEGEGEGKRARQKAIEMERYERDESNNYRERKRVQEKVQREREGGRKGGVGERAVENKVSQCTGASPHSPSPSPSALPTTPQSMTARGGESTSLRPGARSNSNRPAASERQNPGARGPQENGPEGGGGTNGRTAGASRYITQKTPPVRCGVKAAPQTGSNQSKRRVNTAGQSWLRLTGKGGRARGGSVQVREIQQTHTRDRPLVRCTSRRTSRGQRSANPTKVRA